MATRTLTTSYLVRLSVANHDGVTQQILGRLEAAGIDNALLNAAVAEVHQARQAEDAAYRRYSGKDFAADDLKKADVLVDNYMSAIRNVLNGLIYLPDTEPMRRKAQMAVQLFKDFQFSTSDGIEAEARKTINMVQQWNEATEYTLAELGIEQWVQKAKQQADEVLRLVGVRVQNESEKVKGEMAMARKQTDQAIRKAYEVLNALMVLAPTDALTQTVSLLLSIEDRAKLYYISGGKNSGEKPASGSTANEDNGDGSSSNTSNDDDNQGGGGNGNNDDDDNQGGGGSQNTDDDDNNQGGDNGGGGFDDGSGS